MDPAPATGENPPVTRPSTSRPGRTPGSLARRRPTTTVVVALALSVLAVLAGPLGAEARRQAAGSAFPAPVVAPVLNAEVAATIDIRGIWRLDVTDPANPVLAVGFATGFEQPTSDYRVSILVGDPAGLRTRASYNAGAAAGTLETSNDGQVWEPSGETAAAVGAVGDIEITVPVGDLPEGSQVWAEAQDGDDVLTTPVFSLDSLLGRAVDGAMPTQSLGDVVDGAGNPTGETLDLGPGPTLAIVNQGLTVDYAAPVPTDIGGVAVTSVIDRVELAPNFDNGGTRTDAIQIDRTAQTVSLLDGLADPPTTVAGGTDWFIGGFPASGTGPLTFQLGEVAESLGFQLVPDTVGAGIVRTVTLEDGRVVETSPVLATLDWFGTVAGEAAPSTTVGDGSDDGSDTDDEEETTRQILTIGAAALAGVLAIAGIALIASARRKRHGHRILGEHADDRGVVDWTAEMEAVKLDEAPSGRPVDEAEPEPERRSRGARRRAAKAQKADEAERARADDQGEPSPAPVEPAEEIILDPAPAPTPAPAPSPGPTPRSAPPEAGPDAPPSTEKRRRRAPKDEAPAATPVAANDPLAALQAQIGELTTRLDRLGPDDERPPTP